MSDWFELRLWRRRHEELLQEAERARLARRLRAVQRAERRRRRPVLGKWRWWWRKAGECDACSPGC